MLKSRTFKGINFLIVIQVVLSCVAIYLFSLSKRVLWAISPSDENIQELQKEKKEEMASPDLGRMERPRVPYEAENLKDPFQGPVVKGGTTGPGELGVDSRADEPTFGSTLITEEALPPLKIQGIIWGGIFPQAIINDKVVKIGDTIQIGPKLKTMHIVNIDKNGVTVLFGDKQHKLSSPAAKGIPFQTP
jgi:hypothetical protein